MAAVMKKCVLGFVAIALGCGDGSDGGPGSNGDGDINSGDGDGDSGKPNPSGSGGAGGGPDPGMNTGGSSQPGGGGSGNGTPSALQGYGTNSDFGASGTATCEVTSLSDSGAGSLRECVANAEDGAGTTITFDVGGVITMGSKIVIRKSHITIDALDAPSPGITLDIPDGEEGGFDLHGFMDGSRAHDILIRGLRFTGVWDRSGEPDTREGLDRALVVDCDDDADGLSDLNIVFDRNTFVGIKDSAGDVFAKCEGVTLQYNFWLFNFHPVSVAYYDNGQARQRVSVYHNVWFSGEQRSPQIRGDVRDIELVNNVNGGWGEHGVRFRDRNGDITTRANLIKNAFLDDSFADLEETATGHDPSGAVRFRNVPTSACYGEGNSLPSSSETCSADSRFPRADSTEAPTEHELSKLADVLIGDVTRPNVGVRCPSSEEQTVLSAIKAQLEKEFPD